MTYKGTITKEKAKPTDLKVGLIIYWENLYCTINGIKDNILYIQTLSSYKSSNDSTYTLDISLDITLTTIEVFILRFTDEKGENEFIFDNIKVWNRLAFIVEYNNGNCEFTDPLFINMAYPFDIPEKSLLTRINYDEEGKPYYSFGGTLKRLNRNIWSIVTEESPLGEMANNFLPEHVTRMIKLKAIVE